MKYQLFPLLSRSDPNATVSWNNGKAISQRLFLKQARRLAQRLPQHEYVINLCDDRYYFLLVFTAMLLQGKTSLLPANRSPGELQSVSARYGNCPCFVDKPQSDLNLEQYPVEPDEIEDDTPEDIPLFPASQRCVVVFTSGSTGQSVPWEKSWGELYRGSEFTVRMLDLEDKTHTVIATVPPQHMYGLETTIIMPLVAGMRLHNGRPFFPHDLQQSLSSVPVPSLLVTTPIHLNACVKANISWPEVNRIISATAPLTAQLAQSAEKHFSSQIQEIYGSTETGAIATRRTSVEEKWTLHHGLQIHADATDNESITVSGGHLLHPVVLNDRIHKEGENSFTLIGRNSDMIKIAGKRVSLSDLNHKLLSIPGVKDGVFFEAPVDGQQSVSRLCALVVAPELSREEILERLKKQIDLVYLPRPLYQVAQLPRTESGKLPRHELLKLLSQLRRE